MAIADKLTQIHTNVPLVYNSGSVSGKKEVLAYETPLSGSASAYFSKIARTVPEINIDSSVTDFHAMFGNCLKLETVPTIDISNATGNLSNFAYNCISLKNITFSGTIPLSISFAESYDLTKESVDSIVNALITITDGTPRTLKLTSKAKQHLTEEQIVLITETKGWTLA